MRYFALDSRKVLLVVPEECLHETVKVVCCNIWMDDVAMLMPDEFSENVFIKFPEYSNYKIIELSKENISEFTLNL